MMNVCFGVSVLSYFSASADTVRSISGRPLFPASLLPKSIILTRANVAMCLLDEGSPLRCGVQHGRQESKQHPRLSCDCHVRYSSAQVVWLVDNSGVSAKH